LNGRTAFSLFLLIGGLTLFVSTFSIGLPEEGTRILPQVYSLIIAGGGGIELVRSLRSDDSKGANSPGGEGSSEAGTRRGPISGPFLVVSAIVIYVATLNLTGYLIGTTLLGVAMLWILGRRFGRSLFIFPITMSVTLYLLFEKVLSVQLP
jgi:Tripartite tricarboxylate transporter TctB family